MHDIKQIDALAGLCGLPAHYIDAAGNPATIETDYKLNALKAMGVAAGNELEVQASIDGILRKQWSSLIPVVHVVHCGALFTVPVQVDEAHRNESLRGEIILEDNRSIPLAINLSELPEEDRLSVDQQERIRLLCPLPEDLPAGYHQLSVTLSAHQEADHHDSCRLIVAPQTCYEPDILSFEQPGPTEKIWGVSVQLYTLRSENNWGMGDFSDLKQLVNKLGPQGADIVGLNPIHSLYPSNPLHCSPYSPSSRNFINPLYIDVTALQEYQDSAEIQQHVNSDDFLRQLQKARDSSHVEYDRVASLKFSVLEMAFSYFEKHASGQQASGQQASGQQESTNQSCKSADFSHYCEEKGQDLELQATYEALFEHFRSRDINSWGWNCWPADYQDPDSPNVKDFVARSKERVRFYMYLQWLAEQQLAEAQQAAVESGMRVGIYRDLAVGVDRGGADVWAHRDDYVLNASVGAPPDTVAPQGQNWGLPPFNPNRLREQAYAPFIDMVYANMQHCAALRIDHVMGILRLWWCPPDKTADYGVYVNYPLDDLLGIIKLESQRQQCLIFGEDLGTVPPEVEAALPAAHCYSNEVVLFSRVEDHFLAPAKYKPRALTCISNHDIPTLRAWWNCNDLDLRQELGIYDWARTEQEKVARHEDKLALLNTLADIGEAPYGVDPSDLNSMGYSRELMEKIHYYLGKTASKIIVIQLEDVLELDTPVNVPGTSSEYRNWSRKLTRTISEIFASEENRVLFKNLGLTRKA
ncbi:4-alpha-glucanotransferase [Endozoicomonas acroporae]|uniref:4-alpha-glucanotransferase n=1 Tax=Endozoicomonas acroporae TaxID=1701104 RepID=UPI003D7A5785